jgi:hypothetical protein
MKRSLQKVNNRINGMSAADPMEVLQQLPQLQSVTPKNNGRMGG